MVSPSWETPEQWYQTNLISKVKIVNSLLGQSWLRGYIRVSTPEVYGSTLVKLMKILFMRPPLHMLFLMQQLIAI